MRIQATNRQIFDITVKGDKKEERLKCPNCVHTHSSRKQNQKDLSWNNKENRGYCHRCAEAFFEYKPYTQKKDYYVPQWENKTELTDKAVRYWESRMISQNTLKKCNVYSDTVWMPQFNKEVEVMAFPYFRDDKLINIKYRGAKKSMRLIKGAELIFLNEDALKKYNDIIVVEGEPDYLTWIENGYENVISTPNGANSKEMEYFEKVSELFEKIEQVYIAVDNDTEGIKLRDELIRRIGADKCKVVNFKECKDANDYFVNYGGLEFKKLLSQSKDVPIEGVVEITDLYNDLVNFFKKGIQPGLKLGIDNIDQYVTWELGRLSVVSGIPGCFYKDQLIHTSKGVKPISEIKEGEYVLSYNHLKRQNEYRKVLKTHEYKKHTDKLYKIKMKDGTVIKVTENHKFFNGVQYVKIKDYLLYLNNKW
jgi:twinkle protein